MRFITSSANKAWDATRLEKDKKKQSLGWEGRKKKEKTPPTGLEPATPGLGGRCHIH